MVNHRPDPATVMNRRFLLAGSNVPVTPVKLVAVIAPAPDELTTKINIEYPSPDAAGGQVNVYISQAIFLFSCWRARSTRRRPMTAQASFPHAPSSILSVETSKIFSLIADHIIILLKCWVLENSALAAFPTPQVGIDFPGPGL